MYEPKPGDRVRITRYREGKIEAACIVKIVEAGPYGYLAHGDDGTRGFYADSAAFAKGMRGWTQTIEPQGEPS